jgi:hypothetical protein
MFVGMDARPQPHARFRDGKKGNELRNRNVLNDWSM